MLKSSRGLVVGNFLKSNTKIWAEEYNYFKKKVSDNSLSDKANSIKVALESGHNCTATTVKLIAEVTSILLGEDIKVKSRKKGSVIFHPMIMIVPIANKGGHDYTIGKPVLIKTGSAVAVRSNGTSGNNLDKLKFSNRPATDEEIDNFINSKAIKKLFSI